MVSVRPVPPLRSPAPSPHLTTAALQICLCGCCIPLELIVPLLLAYFHRLGLFRVIPLHWFSLEWWRGQKAASDVQPPPPVDASCGACCSSATPDDGDLRSRKPSEPYQH